MPETGDTDTQSFGPPQGLLVSYKATGWAYDLPLRGPAKPVLVALADFADEAGSCYPGQDRLCQMTGLSIRTVRRALERLEALELIRREHRHDARGHRTSDRYILAITTQSLPVTVTSGQADLRSESPSLPVTQSIPTGHSDRVTISRTTRDPSGGCDAPTPRLSLTCNRHPDGTDKPCAACRKAREAFEAAEAEPVRLIPKHRYDPAVHCEHLQLVGKCDVCADEQNRAMAILEAQFGSNQ